MSNQKVTVSHEIFVPMAAPPVRSSMKRGFERLAALMAWDPGLAMVPRFRAANVFNILCLQAEIRDLEEQLEVQMRKDDLSLEEECLYSCNIDILRDHGKDSLQWKLISALRLKLEQYSEFKHHAAPSLVEMQAFEAVLCISSFLALLMIVCINPHADQAIVQYMTLNDQSSPSPYDYDLLSTLR